jgi:hypothetical protein
MNSFFVEYSQPELPPRARVDLHTADGTPVPVEAVCVPPTPPNPEWHVNGKPLPKQLADAITDRARGLGVPGV